MRGRIGEKSRLHSHPLANPNASADGRDYVLHVARLLVLMLVG
jgi:hypothetical protein